MGKTGGSIIGVIESRMNVDIAWTGEKPEKKNTHLVIYHQQEHGYATALAGQALIGQQEPIAKIYSNLMSVGGVNYIPSPFWPEYRLYEVYNKNGDRTFILRIPSLYPVEPTMRPNANPMVWLYTYPIVRDIVMLLNDVGVNRMTYLTANLFRFHRVDEDVGEIGHGHIVEYDFLRLTEEVDKYYGDNTVETRDDFAVAPNVWIWCDVFATFCANTPRFSEVVMGAISTDFMDSDTADTMLRHMEEKYGLLHDEEALEELTMKLSQLKDMTYVDATEVFSPDGFNKDGFNTDSTDKGDFIP